MAIAFDAASNGGAFASHLNTLSWNHTCTGSNLLLVVGVCLTDSGSDPTATYNGVSMTKIASQTGSGSGDRVILFYLINPATGTHSVTITETGTLVSSGGGISLTGVKQSAQPDASGTTGGNPAPSLAVTSVADNSWYVDIAGIGLAGSAVNFNTPVPGLQKVNVNNTVATFGWALAMQVYGPKTPAGSTTLSWTESLAAGSDYVVASFAPAPTTQILKVSGVAQASISKISGVANASIKKVSGVSNG